MRCKQRKRTKSEQSKEHRESTKRADVESTGTSGVYTIVVVPTDGQESLVLSATH